MKAAKLITETLAEVSAMKKATESGAQARELALVSTHLEDAQLRLLRYTMVEAIQNSSGEGGDS